ncbi:MAG: hypothetical protein RQ743_12095 [Bacteroidales bacterium]|nr:hypothetical protein [Bacteroidales bacterium]
MKKISTSKLAKQLDKEPKELFDKLSAEKLIYRKDDQWNLTHKGKEYGGEMEFYPKTGKEYVVWPTDLNPFQLDSEEREELINATKIGEYFEVSNRRVNQIFSELGWTEKYARGWRATRHGEKNGGRTFNHESGTTYVLWSKSVLNNISLLNSIGSKEIEILEDEKSETVTQNNENPAIADDYRKKFDAKYRTKDGHYVRSRGEKIIDDALYDYGLTHAYERRLPVEKEVLCDFYIPSRNGSKNVYIEYWGMTDDPKYMQRKEAKKEIYFSNDFNLIEIFDKHLENLDDHLPKMLLKYEIKVES